MFNGNIQGSPLHLDGMQVFENALMPEFSEKPNKPLQAKRWMVGKCYLKRVTKKWNKRYGVKLARTFLVHGNCLFAHPKNIAILKKQMETR